MSFLVHGCSHVGFISFAKILRYFETTKGTVQENARNAFPNVYFSFPNVFFPIWESIQNIREVAFR